MSNHQHRVTLVTGASSGIGIEAIKLFLKQGHNIIAVTRNQQRFEARLKEELISSSKLQILETDLTDFVNSSCLLDEKISVVGKVDILVNTVGVFSSLPALELDTGQLLASFSSNMLAPFVTVKAVLPGMIAQRGGVIVNIGSIMGLKASSDVNCLAYGSAKASLIHFTRLLAVEMGRYLIRVNCICPGVLNPISDRASRENYDRLLEVKNILPKQAIPRFVTAAEVAGLISFLASDDAANLTGAVIPMDAGMSAM